MFFSIFSVMKVFLSALYSKKENGKGEKISMEEIKDILIKVLRGMNIDLQENHIEENIDLTGCFQNPLDLLFFFIELEDELHIELPAELLQKTSLKSLHTFADKLYRYISEYALYETGESSQVK